MYVFAYEYGTPAIKVCLYFNFAVVFSSTYFRFPQNTDKKNSQTNWKRGSIYKIKHKSAKVGSVKKSQIMACVQNLSLVKKEENGGNF